jgi:hypothetical protein
MTETVTSGRLIEDSALEFRNDINIGRFRLAVVNRDRPDELVSYDVRKRGKNSVSYRQGIRRN